MEKEIWKDIPGFEGLYQASNQGRIRSLDREVRGKYGNIAVKKGKILSLAKASNGYLVVTLWKDLKKTVKRVHRLVYEAFNGPIPEGMQINHISEDKTDNRLENLNLMTPKENNNWGTHKARVGKGHEKAVLQKDLSGNIVSSFKSIKTAAETLGVSPSLVSMYLSGTKKQKGYMWEFEKEAV